MILTGFALSIAVNTLVTGLIVFRILRVFLKVKAVTTSVERTLGTTGGAQLRHVLFIIIESGMALLAVQISRFVLYIQTSESANNAYVVFICINQMFNVIIIYISYIFVLLITFTTWLGHHANNNFVACLNGTVFQ